MPERQTTRLAAGIFLTVLAVYVLTGSRERPRGDALGMWYPAVNLVQQGSLELGFRWPPDMPRGRGDKFWGITPILPILVHVPGAVLQEIAVSLAPATLDFWRPFCSHLGPATMGALTCVLFFFLCRELGAAVRSASLATVLLAFASTIWVYARYPYSEALQAAAFTAFFVQMLRTLRRPTCRAACWLGLWAGVLFNTKYVFALAILGAGVLMAASLRRRPRRCVELYVAAGLVALPFAALAGWYNFLRWGSIWASGYEPYLHAYFGGSAFDGAWGMVLSPNKSIFIYSPPLIAAMLALPRAGRSDRAYGPALAGLLLPVFLVYAVYRSWSGDYAWGPRFIVFAVPVLMAPLALLLEAAARTYRRATWRALVAAFLLAGASVQIAGNAVYWDHYVRIAMQASSAWLGSPDRRGAYLPERPGGHCDSCFEDMHPVQWLPPFSPVRGHAWLLRSLLRGATWEEAERDAPWHRYTTLTLDIGDTYAPVRLDWWGLLWLRDVPAARGVGAALSVVMLLLGSVGVHLWRRGLR